jgi:hypothetical protein
MRSFVAISACVLSLLVGAAPPANAADSDGVYTVFGIGNDSCGSYIDARRHDKDIHYADWLGGFVSATNHDIHGVKNTLEGTDLAGAMLWLENYCSSHPMQDFSQAALALLYSGRRP